MQKNNQFTEQYSRLNKAQKEAVDTIDGPVMVIAGPGTGKTTILTLRIANILQKTDTPANGILAITYTEAGVKAMRAKLQGIIGDRAHDVRIHTFHGFASSVLAEYPDHFLHMGELKVMTDIEQETFIRTILTDSKFIDLRPSGKPDAYMSGIIRSIDTAKREAMTPEMVRVYAKDQIKSISNDESMISTRGATKGQLKAEARELIEKCERTILFASVYESYEEEKRKAKRMDYNDLIIELLVALKNDELLLRLIQEKYLYIHVDEHQDTNDAQNFIVQLIAEFFDTPNIFIVGDEKQAIYRFQGASVENFLLLQKRWPAMKIISLDTNYRSHQGILDASFGMIEKNYEGDEHSNLRIELNSGQKGTLTRPIDIVFGENTSAIELYLVQELKKITSNEINASVAIIVRRNRDLDRIIRLLETHSIPVSSERSVDIFNHPVGRLFFDLIEYIADPTRVDSLSKTIIAGMWGLPIEDAARLVKLFRSGNHKEIYDQIPALAHINSKKLEDSPVGFLVHVAEESKYISFVSKDPSYIYVWRGIIALAESLARESSTKDPLELISLMLAYRTSAESRTIKVTVGAPDVPIKALTAHASKGLEFDYVFIPYATEDAWVGRPKGASFVLPKKETGDGDIRDIRRLFYVAITRARKHATILAGLEESDGKILTPLRFIDELDTENTARISLPRAGAEKLYEIEKNAVTTDSSRLSVSQQKIIDITKRVLTESGLSVTALNHFIQCPSTFIYQSILKLPQAPALSAEKGTAMHEALSKVWKSEKRSVKDIEEICTESISEYFNESLLSIREKEIARKELLDEIPAVAKALEPHFAIQGTQYIESWIRTQFGDIPLHGKLDALIDTGSDVLVYDYKTKQAMSVAAIRGETKSSDGNYFRQLIFYKILVGDDVRWRLKNIIPALVFVSPDDKGRCPTISVPIESSDIDRVKNEIRSLVESVWSGSIVTLFCSDSACEWCGIKRLL